MKSLNLTPVLLYKIMTLPYIYFLKCIKMHTILFKDSKANQVKGKIRIPVLDKN